MLGPSFVSGGQQVFEFAHMMAYSEVYLRCPQHGGPGGPGHRDVVDGVEPQLRPEGVPVALHHIRQGQDVGVEVAVVELAEGLPPHEIG